MTKQSFYPAPNIFSEVHRKLPSSLYMSDIDNLEYKADNISFRIDGENKLYTEYRNNKKAKPPDIEVTAIFDYKHTLSDRLKAEIESPVINSSIWFERWLAEKLGAQFFIVCATDGKMPLWFYKATKTSFEKVGCLAVDFPEVLTEFWESILQIAIKPYHSIK